jgi:hypothetical protein
MTEASPEKEGGAPRMDTMDAPIATASAPSAAPLPTEAPPPPDQLAITITLANGTRLEISAALSPPALSCIIGALR